MGRTYEGIDARLTAWLEAQPVFFVASAPLAADGHVNLSPKGNRHELVVLGTSTVAYLDQTGSGAETISHVRENGRIVLMACAFAGPPRIVRLHGVGRVIVPGDDDWSGIATVLAARAADLQRAGSPQHHPNRGQPGCRLLWVRRPAHGLRSPSRHHGRVVSTEKARGYRRLPGGKQQIEYRRPSGPRSC